jgi:3-methyladenine DNA glycosylase AlkC
MIERLLRFRLYRHFLSHRWSKQKRKSVERLASSGHQGRL